MKIIANTYWKYLSLLFVLLLAQLSIVAQQQLSLSEAITLGLQNNYDITISKLEHQSAKRQLDIGVPEGIPEIRFKLDQINRLSVDGSPTSFVNGNYTKSEIAGGLDLDWVLFHGYKVRINKTRLKELETQGATKLQVTLENTVEAITNAYYRSVIELKKLNFRKEVCTNSNAKFQNAKLRLEYGEISRFDHFNFKESMLQDSIDLYEQNIAYQETLTKLKTLIGFTANENISPIEELQFKELQLNFEQLKNEMISVNPQIRNELLNISIQENAVQLAKAEKMPRIALRSGLSEELNSSKFSNDEQRESGAVFDFNVNLSLTYTLFNKRDFNKKIQKEQMNRLIAWEQMESLKVQLSEQLKLSTDKYQQSLYILKLKQNLLAELEDNISIAADRFESGNSLFIEYRDLLQKQVEIQLSILESIFELKVAETQIVKLTGGILRKE